MQSLQMPCYVVHALACCGAFWQPFPHQLPPQCEPCAVATSCTIGLVALMHERIDALAWSCQRADGTAGEIVGTSGRGAHRAHRALCGLRRHGVLDHAGCVPPRPCCGQWNCRRLLTQRACAVAHAVAARGAGGLLQANPTITECAGGVAAAAVLAHGLPRRSALGVMLAGGAVLALPTLQWGR